MHCDLSTAVLAHTTPTSYTTARREVAHLFPCRIWIPLWSFSRYAVFPNSPAVTSLFSRSRCDIPHNNVLKIEKSTSSLQYTTTSKLIHQHQLVPPGCLQSVCNTTAEGRGASLKHDKNQKTIIRSVGTFAMKECVTVYVSPFISPFPAPFSCHGRHSFVRMN